MLHGDEPWYKNKQGRHTKGIYMTDVTLGYKTGLFFVKLDMSNGASNYHYA